MSESGTPQTTTVHIYLYDVAGRAQKNDKVKVRMNVPFAYYNGDVIKQEQLEFTADVNGLVSIPLINTDILQLSWEETGDPTVCYEFNIAGRVFKRVTIPTGYTTISFKDLPEATWTDVSAVEVAT